MIWEKKGVIFNVKGNYSWNKSHAQLPIVDLNYKSKWRIYYATRNKKGQSNVSYFEVKPGSPSEILYEHDEPILELGNVGAFDENGIMPVAVVDYNGRKYLYYAGWSLRKTTPYHNTIGLAISKDNGATFHKYGEGSVLRECQLEPYSTGTINIIIEKDIWKGWYQSVTKWVRIKGNLEPYYHIKYAESKDGIHWERKGQVAIDYKNDKEAGICAASVLVEKDIYKMWYSFRNIDNFRIDKKDSYRIGYAESKNGIVWTRKDELSGIDISDIGWDSEMIEYPNVCVYEGKKYMFYNGNGFGSSGIGYAISK